MTDKNTGLLADLEEFGLSNNEGRIYVALLEEGIATKASTLGEKTGIHRQHIYRVLERLLELGLAVKVSRGSQYLFKATSPSTIEKIARKRMWKATDLVDSLGEISALDHEQDFEVIVGERGIRQYQLDFVAKASVGETQHILGGSAPQFIAALGESYPRMLAEQEKKGFVTYYIGNKGEDSSLSAYKESRVNFNVRLLAGIPSMLPQFTIRRNTVELYSFFNPPILYVIKSKEVADKFRAFFMMLWEMAGE